MNIVTKKPKHKILITFEDVKWCHFVKSINDNLDELYNIESESLYCKNDILKYVSMAGNDYTIVIMLDIEIGKLNKIESRAVCVRDKAGLKKSNTDKSHKLQNCIRKNIEMDGFSCSNFDKANTSVESIKHYTDEYNWFFSTDIPIVEVNCNIIQEDLGRLRNIIIESLSDYIYKGK